MQFDLFGETGSGTDRATDTVTDMATDSETDKTRHSASEIMYTANGLDRAQTL